MDQAAVWTDHEIRSISQPHLPNFSTSSSLSTQSHKFNPMFKCKGITIFVLLTLVLSVLAASPYSDPEPALGNNGTDEPWVTELWDGYRPESWSYTRSLKDWSHCNYSSRMDCAAVSVVRWDGKFYDPLSFKGVKNDSYGTQYSKNLCCMDISDFSQSCCVSLEHGGCVSRPQRTAGSVILTCSTELL